MEDNRDRRMVYEPMWRPIKVFGLPRDYFYILATIVPIIWGLTTNAIIAGAVFAVLYVFGYLVSQKDPEFLLVRLVKVLKLKGRSTVFMKKRGSVYLP